MAKSLENKQTINSANNKRQKHQNLFEIIRALNTKMKTKN